MITAVIPQGYKDFELEELIQSSNALEKEFDGVIKVSKVINKIDLSKDMDKISKDIVKMISKRIIAKVNKNFIEVYGV